jgi:hypothetical protein
MISTFPAGPARNRAVGVFAAMEGLGAGAGLLLGGVIVDNLSWRWVFFINVPVAALVLALTPIFIPAPARRRDRFDLPGAVTATAGLALVVFGLSRAADHGWGDLSTLGSLLGGTAALLVFVLLEHRGTTPLMPLWVFTDRNRAGAYAIQALLGAALFGMFFLVTLFLQHVLHYSAFKAGAAFVPATVIMMVAAGVMTKVVPHTGVRPLVAGGTATAAAGMWLLSNVSPDSDYLTAVMLPMVLLTTGLGSVFVPATLAAVSGVREEHSGLVSGVSTTAIQIGGSIGLAVLATVAATTTRSSFAGGASEADALTAGYTHAFQIAAAILALAVPIAVATLRLRPSAEDTTSDHPNRVPESEPV